MALRRRRGGGEEMNAWPGYVDALSTLLMVIIFVLLVFVLAQAFLQVALNGRDRALDRLGRQVAELADMLSLERGKTHDMQVTAERLTQDLRAALAAKDQAAAQITALTTAQQEAAKERDAALAYDAQVKARLSDAQSQLRAAVTRAQAVQDRLQQDAGRAGMLAASAIAQLTDQVRSLTALRDDLTLQLTAATSKADNAGQKAAALAMQLADSQKLAGSAQAQVALLTQQVDALKAQLAQVAAALKLSDAQGKAQDAKIADLGQKLNVALASKVAELQRYRSEFFGRLRTVLAGRPGIAVVGDRFVFQSEVLFPSGSADLTPAGRDQLSKLAATLKSIAPSIPKEVNWVLRVDGHADKQRTHGIFASNWELSAARAINVVKVLISNGVPAERLAAAGFGEFQPIDSGSSPAAMARNRRIELRLTDR